LSRNIGSQTKKWEAHDNLEQENDLSLTDLFSIEQLQKVQSALSKATGVAAVITTPDGKPVTAPSNFCRLCKDVIRKTQKGRANCFHSDAVIGKQNPGGPIVQVCLSGGIWDAGASINAGGRHVGNLLMGQVKNELIAEDQLLKYAREIGADEAEFAEALRDVTTMSIEKFQDIANLGFVIANELSNQALQSLQQKRHIAARRKVEIALQESSDRLELLLGLNNAVVSNLDLDTLVHLIPARVRAAMQCDSVYLSMPDAERRNFVVRGLDFPESRGFLCEGATIEMLGSGVGDAFSAGKSHRCGTEIKEQNPNARNIILGEGFRSECFIPVISGDEKLAVLHLSDRRPDRFTAQDIAFLNQVAGQIAIALGNALKYQKLSATRQRLADENNYLATEIQGDHPFKEIVGKSASLRKALERVSTVAETDMTVLINSETGTGKELIARTIHNLSPRRDRMFVKVNCVTIPAGLLESELFGHERGAFTGAHGRKIGRFEVADGGTLFLDEIGDFPVELQPKLLRVLQEQEFERVGGTHPIRVNVRVISATNRNLEQMMRDNLFRPDLYYRLNVFPIRLSPLRDRREDIPPLVEYYVAVYARKMNRHIRDIPADVMAALVDYDWPGNVRELQNLIQRAVLLSPSDELVSPFSELRGLSAPDAVPARDDGDDTLVDLERRHILQVLRETGGVLGGARGAAARLGIPRTTLIYKMRRLSIPREDGYSN